MTQQTGISMSVIGKKLSCVKSPEIVYGSSCKSCFLSRAINVHTIPDARISLMIKELICKGLEWCMCKSDHDAVIVYFVQYFMRNFHRKIAINFCNRCGLIVLY